MKAHFFFKGFQWDALLQRKINPPFVPEVKGAGDATNFDFYEETPVKTSSKILYQKEFDKIEI